MEKDLAAFKSNWQKLPRVIANEALNEFRENFRRQGFQDSGTTKWKERKNNVDPGRGILIGSMSAKKTGSGKKLSRSLKQIKISQRKIVVGSTVKYAGVHNYGLRSGRGKGFKMPQRRFIGHSRNLSSKIRNLILRFTDKGFDK